MNRSSRPRLRALVTAALLAGTAFAGVVVASPAATAAVPHPDLLVVDRNGRLLEIPAGSDQATEVATNLGTASFVNPDRRGRPWVSTWPQVFPAPSGPGPHSGLGGFASAFDTVFSGGRAFVSDGNTLVSMALDGTDRRTIEAGTSLYGLTTTPDGDILAAAGVDGKVLRITPEGVVSDFAVGISFPFDIAQDPDGSYVVGGSRAVTRVPAAGGAAQTITNQITDVFGVTVDADGTIYATDFGRGDLYSIPDDSETPQLVASGLGLPLGVMVAQPILPPFPQSISFTSTAPTTAVVDGASYTPTATGGASGEPVTFSTTTPSTCTYSSTTGAVSFVGAGSCTVAADQAGDTDHDPAPTETQTFTVGKGAQAIAFAADTPTTGTVGESFTPSATGGASGNPVTFTATGGCTLQGSVNGDTVTFTRRGTCTVTATQAGDENYDAAPAEQAPITVQPRTGAQAITFTSTAPTTAVVDGTSYTPTASGGGSGQPVTFSTTTPDTCTYSTSTNAVSFVGAGDCTIAADQAAGTDADDVDYTAAPRKTQTFTVGKGTQTITFDEDTPTTGTVGESFTPSATGGASGNPVTFTVSGGACSQSNSVNADTVTFIRRGTCVVEANQPGDENYEDAPATQASIAVEVAPTTLDLEVTDEGMTATVTGPENGPAPKGAVTFSLDDYDLLEVTLAPVAGEPTRATATLPASADPGDSGQIEATYAGLDDNDGAGLLGGSEDTYTRTAPTVTATVTSDEPANTAGWYRTRATVTFTCEPGSAELVTDCPAPVSRANSRPDFAATGTVTAADGGNGAASVPLQVDTRGPVLSTRRVGSAPYSRTARPVRCTATDARSGVDGSCTVTYGRVVAGPNGGARRTWTATATDVAGNTTTRTNSFVVAGSAPRPTRSPGR